MDLKYETQGETVTISLNRPEKRNALTAGLTESLSHAIEAAERSAKVAIITGEGTAFCSGVDLRESPLSDKMTYEEHRENLGNFQAVTRKIRDAAIPVIARVNGPAMGAGCDIALSADFRITTNDAIFCESFTNVGVISGDGGTFLLPRLLGEARAKELLMLGREVTGREAAELELVTEAVPSDQLDEAVTNLVNELLKLSPQAVAQTKKLVNESFCQSRENAYRAATDAFWICLGTGDFEEARKSFGLD